MSESACPSKNESVDLRTESISFRDIPGQSRLFLDYLYDPSSLAEFYPNAVSRSDDLIDKVPFVLESYATDRMILCELLERQNASFGCGQETLDHIELLRESDCVAVLTGQQAGLFTGPLYSIYKALTAIRTASRLREKGVNAVSIFWIATEDHDLEEVSNAFAISGNGTLFASKLESPEAENGKPVGAIDLVSNVGDLIDELMVTLPSTEFSEELKGILSESYSTTKTFGSSFAKLLTRLLGKYGLIVFDPMDDGAKKLTADIFQKAITNSDEIVRSLIERSRALESVGYHAQVLVEEDYFPLFWLDDTGIRRSLKRTSDGRFRAGGTRKEFSRDELVEIAATNPEDLSAGVMLRPVVQDVLFPTICYFGGAAEIAYFAQNSEVYRILERPITSILPRQSFTIIEAKYERTMKKYGIAFNDLVDGIERLRPRIVEEVIDPETPKVFAEAEEKINTELNRLDQHLSKIDSTLAESLAKRRRKIIYHIGALRKKFQRVRIEKDETINRQMVSMFNSLMPNGALQERSLNFSVFANRYGTDFIDWIYDSIDVDENEHKLMYL